jgi:hypothetical protein
MNSSKKTSKNHKPDIYIKNNKQYLQQLAKMERGYGPLILSQEYSYFVRDNTLQLLVRLARYKSEAAWVWVLIS